MSSSDWERLRQRAHKPHPLPARRADLPRRPWQASRAQLLPAGLHRLRVVSGGQAAGRRHIERVFSERDTRLLPLVPDSLNGLASSAHTGMAPAYQEVRRVHSPLGLGRPDRAGHDLRCAAHPCVRDRRRILRYPLSPPCCGYRASRAELHRYVGAATHSPSARLTDETRLHTHTYAPSLHRHPRCTEYIHLHAKLPNQHEGQASASRHGATWSVGSSWTLYPSSKTMWASSRRLQDGSSCCWRVSCYRARLLRARVAYLTNLLGTAAHEPWIPSLHRDVLRSVARYLRQGLDVLGIKISLVAVGPSAPVSKPAELTGSETGCAVVVTRAFEASLVGPLICAYHGRSVAPMCAPKQRGGKQECFLYMHCFVSSSGISVYIPSLRNTIEDVLSLFAVRYEDVWRVVQRVLLSRSVIVKRSLRSGKNSY